MKVRPLVTAPIAKQQAPRRPRFQFSLQALMVLTLVAAVVASFGFYMMRGASGSATDSRLVGMLMVLAGPLLLMTVLSVFLSIMRRR
jgi:hypothetical protein